MEQDPANVRIKTEPGLEEDTKPPIGLQAGQYAEGGGDQNGYNKEQQQQEQPGY